MKNQPLTDRLKISNPKFLSDSLNLLSDMAATGKQAVLRVPIRATHSGYLLNKRVYPGYSMRDATETWIKPYEKPVLRHHDDFSDPIGRVKGAKFYQLKNGNDFELDYQNPDTGEKLGSGFIIINTEITDKDAIEKILDGRYTTVSTSHTASATICSACGIDWQGPEVEDCNHYPGRPFTDKKTGETIIPYLITPIDSYRENSFVNVPAQPNTKILGKELIEDSLKEDIFINDGICTLDSLLLCDYDGNSIDLLLKEGVKDQMPNEAVLLRAKRVFSFTSKELDMSKKTSDDADKAMEKLKAGPEAGKAVEDASKAEAKPEAKPEAKKEEPAKDKEEAKQEGPTVALLTSALEDMKRVKEELSAKNKELQVSLDTKTSVVDSMTQEIAKLKTENVRQLARQLAVTRINLNKSGTEGITSKDKLDTYVEQLTKRSADSLQDSLNDLLPELEDAMKSRKTFGLFIDKKVENPVSSKQDLTNSDSKAQASELKSKTEFLKELN